MSQRLKVAIAQATPAMLDLATGVRQATKWIDRAGKAGAKILAFPESWLGGYPVWLDEAPKAAAWDHPPANALFRRLRACAIELDGPELVELQQAAQKADCHVVMGVHERRGGTLTNTMVFLSADGQMRRIHRKLVPTYAERLVWGRGDGSTLEALPTKWGPLGGLVCWEHWMPLARQHMHGQAETVHVAQWPTVHARHQLGSAHYAFEGGCFVLAAGSILTRGQLLESYRAGGADEGLELLEAIEGPNDRWLMRGGSTVYTPEGEALAPNAFESEALLEFELDLDLVENARLTRDVAGHYSRPDVFEMKVDRREKGPA